MKLEGRLYIRQSGSEVVALAPDLALSVPHSLNPCVVKILRAEVLSGVEGQLVGSYLT